MTLLYTVRLGDTYLVYIRILSIKLNSKLSFDWVFVIITGFIAWHGLTYKNTEGKSDSVRLLFGCIALLFCIRVLILDIMGI